MWKFYGYVRQKFLTFAFGGVKKGGLGTGTYALQQEVEDVFWGTGLVVECVGPDAMYVRCPVVMYRRERADRLNLYRVFLSRPCEKVLLSPPETCEVAKKEHK